MVFPGFAVATEAIPGMTVRVGLRKTDVKMVVFAQVLANVVNFNFSSRRTQVFAVILLHSVC